MLSTWHSDDSTVARWTHAVARVRFNIPVAWAIGLAALLIVPSFAVWADPVEDAQPSAGDLQQRLRGAAAAIAHQDPQGLVLLQGLVDDPAFARLDPLVQHAALQLGESEALKRKDYHHAQALSMRATALPERTLDDWQLRLDASWQLHDRGDELVCVTMLARNWGSQLWQSGPFIMRVLGDTRRPELADLRRMALQALYDQRWSPDDVDTSALWRELSLLLVENGQIEPAKDVAAHVSNPSDVILLNVDRRYAPLLRARFVPTDPAKAAKVWLADLKKSAEGEPRSLALSVRYGRALLRFGRFQDALQFAEALRVRLENQSAGEAVFNDGKQHGNELYELEADALIGLQRYEDAVAAYQRGAKFNPDGAINQGIDGAEFLLSLDRAQEALQWLPDDSKASPYGRTIIALVRVTAALQLGDMELQSRELQYLQDHESDSPSAFERALLRVGNSAQAAQLMVTRLRDPMQRDAALLSLQEYAPEVGPVRMQQWHQQSQQLAQDPAVQAALKQVGEIRHYPWFHQ